MKKQKMLLAILILFFLIIGILYLCRPKAGPVTVLSLSSDGKYAVSSNFNNFLILWDISNRQKKIISRHANIYSAYFIKKTPYFIWQDLDNYVHVQSINGKEILKFHNFPTYGQVMTSDLKHYFASAQNWNLYSGYGKSQKMIMNDYERGGFIGAGKLFNLTLSNDNRYLLTSGLGGDFDKIPVNILTNQQAEEHGYDVGNESLFDGTTLWNVDTGIPFQKFPGHYAKLIATLSPDDKYVVGGDEGSGAFLWNTQTGKRVFELDDLYWGHPNNSNDMPSTWDRSHLIKIPDDFVEKNGSTSYRAILSFKFIDLNGHYLRFTTYVPYAVLHSVTDPAPLKYFRLGKDPFPSVSNYSRDQSIDTAPAANILVTGQDDGNGIIVYHFDPQKLTLEKVWVTKG